MFNNAVNLLKKIRSLLNFKARARLKNDLSSFRLSSKTESRFELNIKDCFFINNEKTDVTYFDRHYVYHTAWAARCIKKINPVVHTDISSSLYFCGIASAFCKINFYDYRPPELVLDDLKCMRADLTQLDFPTNSLKSVSCMHTIEHVGLGRYGEDFDYDGDLKALDELKRVTAPAGDLLIVVPVGKISKIVFNAHRIYHPSLIVNYFADFDLVEFAMVPEQASDGGLVVGPDETLIQKQDYACGCFWFKKH